MSSTPVDRNGDCVMNGAQKRIDEAEGFEPFKSLGTIATHAGHVPFDHEGIGYPIVPPITLSTTFQQKEPGVAKYDYSRGNNYSRESLETTIATLEGGKYCKTFSSGLAALNAVVQLLKSGEHIVCNEDVYGGTNRFLNRIATGFGIEVSMVDLSDLDKLRAAMKPNTKLVWLESPTNPLMRLIDIEAVSKAAHDCNKDVIVVTDNTFMSSIFQRPLSLGSDVTMHSLTKYMNGHTDVLMGAVITNRDDLFERLAFVQFAAGSVPSPFDCFLVQRGLRTLPVRMREHMRNGLGVARFLESHPLIEKVVHPGLKSHPQHDLARKQMRGYSGMVSAYVKGGREETSALLKNLKLFALAESLGGFESLIEIPSIMTHASVPEEQRAELGITDNLIRLSVGLEELEELIADLDQGLKKMTLK